MDAESVIADHDWSTVVADLADQGFVVRRGFFASVVTDALHADLAGLHARRQFAQAGVGRNRVIHSQLRSDEIWWFDPVSLSLPQCAYLQTIESFRLALNLHLQLAVFDFECHYTIYQAGSHYSKHVDQPRGSNARVVSIITYLNHGWNASDEGALRLFLPDGELDVLPEAGTLVAFFSKELPHAVLAPRRDRYSVTGWLRHRE